MSLESHHFGFVQVVLVIQASWPIWRYRFMKTPKSIEQHASGVRHPSNPARLGLWAPQWLPPWL